jgi:hypothetical protein
MSVEVAILISLAVGAGIAAGVFVVARSAIQIGKRRLPRDGKTALWTRQRGDLLPEQSSFLALKLFFGDHSAVLQFSKAC